MRHGSPGISDRSHPTHTDVSCAETSKACKILHAALLFIDACGCSYQTTFIINSKRSTSHQLLHAGVETQAEHPICARIRLSFRLAAASGAAAAGDPVERDDPVESVPAAMRYVMLTVPNTYFVALARAVPLRSAGYAVVWPQHLPPAMFAFACANSTASCADRWGSVSGFWLHLFNRAEKL